MPTRTASPEFRLVLALVTLHFAAACDRGTPRTRQEAEGATPAAEPGVARAGRASTPMRLVLERQDPGIEALLQAVSPVSEQVAWISGHQGVWIRTEDGGATWIRGGVEGHPALQFRDVHAFDANTAVLMSAGEGADSRLFRTEDGGRSWAETFVMDHPAGFLDCVDFWDRSRGLAYGDAVDGGLYLLRTGDGGRSWSRVDPAILPAALEGEGGFAASGTCLRTRAPADAWVATGNGARPRLLRTSDAGVSWVATQLPLDAGPARGATTVGFRPDGLGFALGGNIGEGAAGPRAALSADDGLSWSITGGLVLEGAVYGAAWVPGLDPATLFAVGPGGMDWSTDGGMSWAAADSLTWWAVDFASPAAGWAVGPDGRILKITIER